MAGQRDDRLHVDGVEVGPLLPVDLDADEVLVHQRRGLRRPRTTRAPSRGTSGRRRSRSRAGSAGPRSARARAPRRPTGTSRPGCSACCSRYGLVSAARRFMRGPRVPRARRVSDQRLRPGGVEPAVERARVGRGRRADRPSGDELGELRPRDAVGAGDVQRPGEVESRPARAAPPRGRATWIGQRISFVKNVAGRVARRELVLRRLKGVVSPAVDQRGRHEQRAGVSGGHPPLRLCLRPPVLRDRRRRVRLDVRRALAPVEARRRSTGARAARRRPPPPVQRSPSRRPSLPMRPRLSCR